MMLLNLILDFGFTIYEFLDFRFTIFDLRIKRLSQFYFRFRNYDLRIKKMTNKYQINCVVNPKSKIQNKIFPDYNHSHSYNFGYKLYMMFLMQGNEDYL